MGCEGCFSCLISHPLLSSIKLVIGCLAEVPFELRDVDPGIEDCGDLFPGEMFFLPHIHIDLCMFSNI